MSVNVMDHPDLDVDQKRFDERMKNETGIVEKVELLKFELQVTAFQEQMASEVLYTVTRISAVFLT